MDRNIQSMELPNEYILSQNKKYNVQFGKSQKELNQQFSHVFFSGGLGKCSKLKAKLKVKDGAQPIFKKWMSLSLLLSKSTKN